MREYLSPLEMKPGSWAWRVHTNQLVGDTLDAAIRMHYADPEKLTLAEYVLYGQMCQAYLHGPAVEALRFRKNDSVDDCHGALIWSYSEPWGETGWSLLDYYLRRKPSYYWVRRANAPIKVIVRRRGDELATRLVNDTLNPVAGAVEYGWWRLDGAKRETQLLKVGIGPNAMQELAREKIPSADERDPRQWLYASVLQDAAGTVVDQSIWLLETHRKLALGAPKIKMVRLADGVLEISSPLFAHAVHTEDYGREFVSDNWFDLLPGVPVRVRPAAGVKADTIRWSPVLGQPRADSLY